MYLREIIIQHIQAEEPYYVRFPEPNHLTHLFSRLLGKYQSAKAGKLVISFIKADLQELNGFPTNQNVPEYALNVVLLYKSFQFDVFDNSSDEKKKLMIWESLYLSLELCCMKFGWDLKPITRVYHTGLELNLVNEYFFDERKKSKNRQLSAAVFCTFDIHSFKAYAVFYNPQGTETKRVLLIDESPFYGEHEAYNFKQTKWLSNNEFALVDKFNNKWIAEVN